MSQDRFPSLDRAQLRDDHEQLRAFLDRLRNEPERARLSALLAELPGHLAEHFRREEAPGGFYDALGVCLGEARGEIGKLLDDHFRLFSMARNMAEEALSASATTAALRERAVRLVDYLAEHEQQERELAIALLEGF